MKKRAAKETYSVLETFVRLGRRVPGVLYEPEGLAEKTVPAVLVMHSDEDYLTCPTGAEMAKRGYRVLCANVMSKEGMFYSLPDKMGGRKGRGEIPQKQSKCGKNLPHGSQRRGHPDDGLSGHRRKRAADFSGPPLHPPLSRQ